MPTNKNFGDPRKKEAVKALYQIGYNMRELKQMLHISTDTIIDILKEAGIESKPKSTKKISDEEMKNIIKRIENGEMKYKIADELGITPSALSKRLSRRQVKEE